MNDPNQRRPRYLVPAFTAALAVLAFHTTSAVVAAAPPEGQAMYPKPGPAKAFASLKIYQPGGSPIRQPKDDWEGARKRLSARPDLQKWVAGQRATTDDWMAKRTDHIEWICGWYHDFVSPKDGSHLTFTPDEPGEYTLHSPSDPRVKLTPKLHAAWVFAFRSQHVKQIESAAKLYRLTGERKYADWASGQIDFYADNYAKWPKQSDREGTHFMWQSLDEAVNLVSFVKMARDLGTYVTPERKQKWFTRLFEPECVLLNNSRLTIHNIACWHRSAVGCVAVLYQNEALWKAAVDSPFGIKAQMTKGVTSDYLWEEQSLGYNSYVVSALLPFFEFASTQGDAAKLTHEMETAENLMLAPIAMRFSTGLLPSPADGNTPLTAPNVNFLADAARLFPTSVGLAAARTRMGWNTLLDPLPAPKEVNPVLAPAVSLNMESSRMAILKHGPWQVYFHYGQLVASHAQAEALNFEAFYDKTDVTHDPSTVGYGSPLHKEFYSKAFAHNVPVVDGLGQENWNPGKLLAFEPNGETVRVAASQPAYRKNANAERELQVSPSGLTDTLTLSTTDKKTHELGLFLQIQGKAELPAAFQPDDSLANQTGLLAGFNYWKNVRTASFTDKAALVVTYPDGRKMRVTLTLPGAFTVTHAASPDVPPKQRETFYVRVKGEKAVFKTTIAPE